MARRLIALVGKVALGLVGMALLTAAALFVVAAFAATWPILRLPPRQRHVKAGLDVAVALAALLAAVKGDELAGAFGGQESEDE